MIKRIFKNLLVHPLTKGLNIDDPNTTALRLQIIRSKPFLKKIYEEWYRLIAENFTVGEIVVELGSGAGFLKEIMPQGLITSELFPKPGVDRVIDAQSIYMPDSSLDGIVMTDVLHHIPDCSSFFSECVRLIRPGGRIVMIEPWNTSWSRLVYSHLHHEPFEPNAGMEWQIPLSGPLSGANGALPWIIFHRDRTLFEQRYPKLRVEKVVPMMPVTYLLSGGVSLKSFFPGCLYHFVRFLERHSNEKGWAMFAVISLKREV